MLARSFPGWTIAEALERTSDPGLSDDVGESDSEITSEQMRALRERLGKADLVLTGSFSAPTALPSPIEPRDLIAFDWSGVPSSSLIGDIEIFNVRVFPVLNAPNAGTYLDGLSLTEVFRRFVLDDPEVIVLAKLLSRTDKGEAAVFADGQAPGGIIDYHWPIDATIASLEYKFTSTSLIIIGNPDPPTPPLISRVSEVLALRLGGLRHILESGTVSAFGTFVQTGLEVPIARFQWGRTDISIDVKNGDLCEGQDYRAKPKWTGLSFKMPEAPQPAPRVQSGSTQVVIQSVPKGTGQIQTKENYRLQCVAWLEAMMSDKQIQPRSKEELWAEVQLKWPKKITKRAFLKARDDANSKTGAWIWKAPGRKPKSSHS